MPLALSTWKGMFTDADRRCDEQGLDMRAHAHLLRHTFAVITLEQPLCEKARRGNSEGLPSHGGCLPLACRNVALTTENTVAWQRGIARIDKRLASRPALALRLDTLLRSRRTEIAEFLTANGY